MKSIVRLADSRGEARQGQQIFEIAISFVFGLPASTGIWLKYRPREW